ncbi:MULTISPECIES: RHS repeat-associated core domain-containing protein [Pseudanabaena]|uniref:RHS repeat-associated core domain protein n=2 Tax=Pseudanabaena TaxID=1152 RepID=L8MX26_9CYAN|nr:MULTISPECIES: RHS repeat-associated core domain-containing protein [Pseudanabaena]ELS31339.1 RHS repeat-associated core domain protein [Pseudanabaena biceps PCC 7429]MDG3496401.1 RHS repeat-associated core domain-containing protein [Pseudanabaena catenata USMAC16]
MSSIGTTQNSYLYTGEQFDAGVGQYYLRDRYYNQAIGRFTRSDTWEGNTNNPLSLNKYLYANGNPLAFVDPSGRTAVLDGDIVHEVIGKHFVSEDRINRVYDPRSSQNPGVKVIQQNILRILRRSLGDENESGVRYRNSARPDLTDFKLREIYEVKPRTQLSKAQNQLNRDLAALNLRDPQRWFAGVTYKSYPSVIPITGTNRFALVSTYGPGLIIYDRIGYDEDSPLVLISVAFIRAVEKSQIDLLVSNTRLQASLSRGFF